MLKFIRTDRHRFNVLLCCALSVFTFVFISACSESQDVSTDGNANTGSIPFSVVLHDASSTRALTTPIDCDASGIETLEAKVYSQTDQLLKVSASWSCSDHGGVIENVPPDTYTVCFLGKDSNGNILYRGKSVAIPVRAGEAADTVDIVCYDFKPDLTAPVDGASIVLGSLEFQWQPITGASEYQIQISTDSTFDTTEIIAPIDGGSTSYTPTDTIPAGTIYWRVSATDEYGYTGEWSASGNFTLTTEYTVTFIAGSDGSLTGDTTQVVTHGGSCTPVTADPDPDYHFSFWSGDVPIAQVNDNPLTITNVTSNMTIQANFGLIQWSEISKLLPGDGYQQDLFGQAVSISGDYAIIGAPQDDDNGADSGSAYIFKNEGGTWIQKQKIKPGDGGIWAEFGYSVSISGDYALIGAHQDDNGDGTGNEGAAYIFKNVGGTWTQIKKLIATAPGTALPAGGGPEANGYFGWSVCIYGEWAIVGAYRADPNGDGNREGAAYIFKRDRGDPGEPDDPDNWGIRNMVNAEDYATGDQFGYSVAISDTWALVGARSDDDKGDASGSVYIFKKGPGSFDWWGVLHNIGGDPNQGEYTETFKITASDGAANDQFGYSVSISPSYGMVGAPYHDGTGSVYVLELAGDTWSEHSSIVPSDASTSHEFGISVSSNDDRAIVGSWKTNGTGAAYILNRSVSTWSEDQKLLASDGVGGDSFGVSVSISGDNAIVGAYSDDDGADTDAGSAYIFDYY